MTDVTEATPEVRALLDAYREAKADEDAAKVRAAQIRDQIIAAFTEAGADEFTIDGQKAATYLLKRRTGLDQQMLARLAPKALEKARKVTEYRELRLGR